MKSDGKSAKSDLVRFVIKSHIDAALEISDNMDDKMLSYFLRMARDENKSKSEKE